MFLSPKLISQIIQEAVDLGWNTELQVTKHITSNYGGSLLDNAALVEQHWPVMLRPQATFRTASDAYYPTPQMGIPP